MGEVDIFRSPVKPLGNLFLSFPLFPLHLVYVPHVLPLALLSLKREVRMSFAYDVGSNILANLVAGWMGDIRVGFALGILALLWIGNCPG